MKKRLLSWLLVLTMIASLIPSTLVTTAFAADDPSAQASGQAGKTTVKFDNKWPDDMNADITDVLITGTTIPGPTLTVEKGKTLIVHGSGTLSGSGRAQKTPFFIVEDGGHLVLDNVTLTLNLSAEGTVVVKKGGLLDLGYNDQKERFAPSITDNFTTANLYTKAAKNLVIYDGATVRLNAEATKKIGVTGVNADGSEFSGEPISVIEGGRYTIRGNNDTMENKETMIEADSATLDLTISSGSPYSDVNKTGTKLTLQYVNDHLVLAPSRINVLVWDPIRYWSNSEKNSTTYDGAIFKLINTIGPGNLYGNLYRNGSPSSPRHMNQQDIAAFKQFDMIVLNYPTVELNQEEINGLNDFLCNGGRIFMQFENPNTNAKRKETIVKGQKIANALKAEFEIDDTKWVADNAIVDVNNKAALSKGLTSHKSGKAGYIFSKSDSLTWIFSGKTTTGETSLIVCDQNAGDKNGEKWGALTICGDGVYFDKDSTRDQNQLKNGKQLLENLLQSSRKNRLIAATGVNPNKKIDPQATTTTTTTETKEYSTPYAALQKATETNTVTLLTESRKDTGLTPTRDELLFENATLAYETGSKYDGSTIYAETAGVYADITKTGEVNLHSGTVTVTPKDKTYELILNGTMDADGTAITGGYKITAPNAYTLNAEDEKSPISADNGGKASITLAKKDDSVTVDYGNNEVVTYTAKDDNETIYLGWYVVTKDTPASANWTDAAKAWHGHNFTTTLTPGSGFEVNGEKLTVTDKGINGNYKFKQGKQIADPAGDTNVTWTVYESEETDRDGNPKVVIKQQHLHTGNVDRNGIATVTVNDVRADINIGATDDVVNAASPTIYVVGVGVKDGVQTQLWEYVTTRNTKDGNMSKPVSGWPWEKWIVTKAASATGTQNDYTNNTDGFKDKLFAAAGTDKLNTTNPTAEYTVDLDNGDKVVVFYYDWNMTEVTIKATDANGKPIPDYTNQVVEYELDKQTTITAPNLIGYQPKDNQNTQDFRPTKDGDNTVTFKYEKTTGNLIYKAVYVDGAGVTHDLGTFSGGTLVKGQAPNKAGTAAPTFDNYELVDAGADGTATSAGDATKFDGTNDITVTYKYQPKTKDIAVYAYVGDENGQILNLDKTSYKGITTGQTITVTAPEIAGYKVKGDASKTFFISNNKSENQDVKFFYEKDTSNDAYVLVKLVDSSNSNKVISSYQVPGVKDKAQLIKAPAAPYGYKADPTYNNEDKTVTPTGTAAPFIAEVVFKYVPHVHTVTVVLKDTLNNTNLTVNNFKATYQVVNGESLKITAPSIYGYTMAASAEAVKELTNITKNETVTFEYEPIDKQLVTVHVKGVGPDGKTLFESRETVTHGTASKEVNVFTLPGLKLSRVTVGDADVGVDQVTGNKLTVDTSQAAKGAVIEVVLTYESNMANVTVKAMYNNQQLQSYTIPMEKGVKAQITSPSVPGYTARVQSQELTPTKDAEEVAFEYTKNNGNITVIVKADGQELYRKDGGTVAKGSNITLTGKAAAPTIEYYTTPSAPSSVMVGNTEVKDDLANYTYDGSGDIIVTYEYTRKTQDVTIIKKDVDTGKEITGESETLKTLPVGKSHTFTDGSVKVPDHYKAVADRNPSSYFVEDKANQTVTFWYKNTSADQYAQVTVNLICDSKVFQSYQVTAIKGVPTTIQAPTWTGYERKAGTKASKTVTPNGMPANDKVEFEYTIKDPRTVKVVLTDNESKTLNAPTGYTTEYMLKDGDTLEIWAPAIDGYTLAGATLGSTASPDGKQLVKVAYANLTATETTVTFSYTPVTQANFVTHTIRFVVGTNTLYTYDKMIAKGAGTTVPYSKDDVKSAVPGYSVNDISYEVNSKDATAAEVTDAVNAVIIYHFVEDAATITVKKVDGNNAALGTDTVLTGYRQGQTIQVIAPVMENYALNDDLIKTVTLNSANVDVTFKYVPAGNVTFTLLEKAADGTSTIIKIVNGENGKTYDPSVDGNPLNLTKFGYTYVASDDANDAPFNAATGKLENLDTSNAKNYNVYYNKDTRTVTYIPVNKTALDAAGLTLVQAIQAGTAETTYKISVTPAPMDDARVLETYKAVAQSFNGWTLKDDFSKVYNVEKSTEPLKVYFLYEQKTTGTITVNYYFGDETNLGELLNQYTVKAVAGEKLEVTALEYLLENKYHLRNGQTNPVTIDVTDKAETVNFYYEANFVTVTTKFVLDGGTANAQDKFEATKSLQTNSASLTLTPPNKAGYTLVGITADGATLTNGGADNLPTEYTNNKLALTGLTQNATVTYYYKTTKASEYQTELTVEYKYNGYDLATAKTINANTGEANSIDIPAFDGYTASTYNFTDGSTVKVTVSGVKGTTVSVTPAEKTATLTITYTRPDGSVVLPGNDGKFTAPDNKDNVTVTPDDAGTKLEPNGEPTAPATEPIKGSVTVPADKTATVTRPKDPQSPDNGSEDITVPGGTTINPDGTIILPNGDGKIDPDQKIPENLPNGYVAITYDSNNSNQEVKKEIGKTGELQVKGSLFTDPSNRTFAGWNDSGSGNGKTYAKDTAVSANVTLYAVWDAQYRYSANIIYKANDGSTDQDTQLVGHATDPVLKAKLQVSPFQVSGWTFGGWNESANGSETLYQPGDVLTLNNGKDKELFAQWYKVNADGSIEVPGKDGNPKDASDNATAKGDGKGNDPTRDEATGEIAIPAGGSVTLPDGTVIGMPDGGKLLPNGTVIINRPDTDKDGKSDGTITIPGKTDPTKPDVTDKDGNDVPDAKVYTLTYTINNGEHADDVLVKVVENDSVSIIDCPFVWTDYTFINWMKQPHAVDDPRTEHKAGDKFTVTSDETFHAQWIKINADGSVELPGKDGDITNTPDNVIVTPDQGGKITPQPDGSVKVEDNGGTVTRPTNPDHPENGKEEIKVPEGTVVEPDGTIKLPDGTVIAPDKRIPDDVTPTNYFVVTYEPGEGSGGVIRQIVEKYTDTTLLGADTFTAPNSKTFDGWLDELDSKHDADSQMAVTKNTTLTAQWKDGTPTPPAQDYSAEIVFDPNTGDATATQTISSDSETITRNLDAYTQHFTVPTDWTFMGWSTKKAASQSSTFYEDGEKVTLKDGKTLNLYAIVYKVDADTGVITLPGKGGQPEGGDDVTVTPGAGADLTVDKGFIKAPAGSEIKQPANATPIKVIEGEVNVYPDGSVFVPKGSKVQLPDGTEVDGEATIDPDGNPDTDNTKPIQRPDGTIVLPGENGKTGDTDDITIAPAGSNQPAGRIDEDGNVTITNPDGADVNLPGNTPEDIKVPNGTVIKPNGDMTLLYTIRYVDGNGREIKTATVKSVQRGIPEDVKAAVISGYTLNDTATKIASGEVSTNLADYTITFVYAKDSSGNNGGGTVSSSFVIKANAGNGGIISPSGNVSVKRGDDQTFVINPVNGYRIADVIVDGKSVGAVSLYTFENVRANHTIEVVFTKLNSIVADPTETGVAGWLQTREHIAYLGGYGNGLFGPNDNMTRAQVAQMFYNLLLEKDIPVTTSFSDVPADAWYAKAVNTLASLGIIKGIGNDQFAPNRTITRAEFTVIAMRFANVSATVTNPFSDIASSDWYYTAVTSAVSYGWINGYSDGTFKPMATITRAEVATIVNRMLARTADRNFVDSSAVTRFDDVPATYWAYYNIAEATTAHTHTIDNDGVESWGRLM